MKGTIFKLILEIPDSEVGQLLRLDEEYKLTVQGLDQTPYFDKPYPNITPPAWIRDYQLLLFSADLIFGQSIFTLTRQCNDLLPFVQTWCKIVNPRGLVDVLVLQLPEYKLVQVLHLCLTGKP